MRARVSVLPGVSLGVAKSARQLWLLQLLLVETCSFLLTPGEISPAGGAASSAGVLVELSRVADIGRPRGLPHHRQLHHHHPGRNDCCFPAVHFSDREGSWWPASSPDLSRCWLWHQSHEQPSRPVPDPFPHGSSSSLSSSSCTTTTTTVAPVITSSRHPQTRTLRLLPPSTSTASGNLPSTRRLPLSMGAAASRSPAVSQRSSLRPSLQPEGNGYSYGAATTSLGASQTDAEAPADEFSAAASLVGGEVVGE